MVGGTEWKGERDRIKKMEGRGGRKKRGGEGRERTKRGSKRNERGVKKKEEMKAAKTDNHKCNVNGKGTKEMKDQSFRAQGLEQE